MKHIYLLICLALLISCAKENKENNVHFESDLLSKSYQIVEEYKGTDHIIEKIISLDSISNKTINYIREDSTWNKQRKDKFMAPIKSMLEKTLILSKNIKQDLSDFERIKIIKEIDKSLDESIKKLNKYNRFKKIS